VKRWVSLWAVLALAITGSATPASAQQTSDEWELYAAPYLMGAAMSGVTTVRGVNVDLDLSASDIFSNLQFGAMGLVVARKGDWGFGADLIWMALGTTVRDTNVDFNQHTGHVRVAHAPIQEAFPWLPAGTWNPSGPISAPGTPAGPASASPRAHGALSLHLLPRLGARDGR
jgi:hypothetical protein